MTITVEQLITIASVVTAISVIYGFASKPFKAMKDLQNSVDELTKSVNDMKDDLAMNGDMVYQLLNHAATNNNTGGMQESLDKYNAYYRH